MGLGLHLCALGCSVALHLSVVLIATLFVVENAPRDLVVRNLSTRLVSKPIPSTVSSKLTAEPVRTVKTTRHQSKKSQQGRKPSVSEDAEAKSVASAHENFVPAQRVYFPSPRYPESARQALEEGVVELEIEIASTGEVRAAVVVKGSGFRGLDVAAVEGVKKWRFNPATLNGVPVSTRLSLPVYFKLT